MHYLGGKRRIAKHIAPFLNRHTDATAYYEPFVGGAAVAEHVLIAPKVLSDNHPALCLFYAELQAYYRRGEPFPFLQHEITKAEYLAIKANPSDPTWAFVGFNGSVLGKWWGGWCESTPRRGRIYETGRVAVHKLMSVVCSHTTFAVSDYRDVAPPAGSVIYCDPPYAGTTGYARSKGFDHAEFWAWAEALSDASYVYVSEQTAPPGWASVWSKNITNKASQLSKPRENVQRAEHLFTRGAALAAFPSE